MSLAFLAPLFLAGLAAVAIPVLVHLIRRHRGTPVEFPSLMFLRRLPVRSVRRRRIHNWPLLLLRAAALALIAAAFARPVLQAGDPDEAAGDDAFREVVVVLDRSWSMGLGDRWTRALDGARETVAGLVAPDRVSLVVFQRAGTVVVQPTLDPSAVLAALDTLSPGWDVSRIGAGVQAAAGILEASDRTRREVVLVSDFQRGAWEEGPRDPLPTGVGVIPVDVGAAPAPVVGVAEVSFQYRFEGDRQRVHPRVRVVRFGEGEAAPGRVSLTVDGRVQEEVEVEIPGEGAGAVELTPFLLPPEGIRGSVAVSREGDTALEPFRFVLSPGEVLTVLLVEGPATGGQGGLHLRSALSVAGEEPLRVLRRSVGQLSAQELAAAHVVVVNDAPLPSGEAGRRLRDRVREGAGLVVVAGAGSDPQGWEGAWDEFLPGRPGGPVDRDAVRGASLARVDRDHPVFLPFGVTGRSGLGAPRFFRYRSLEVRGGEVTANEAAAGAGEPATAGAAAASEGGAAGGAATAPDETAPRVLARFDDGSPALAEGRAGEGRVLVWATGMDTGWSDLPLHGVVVPLVHELVRYAAPRGEAQARFQVGQVADRAFLRDRGGLGDDAVLVPPGGAGLSLADIAPGAPGAPPALDRPGFYEVRAGPDEGASVAWTFAVNMDPAAAERSRVDPAELALALTRAPGSAAGGAPATGSGAAAGPADGLREGARGGAGDGAAADGSTRTTDAAPLGAGSTLPERERRQGAWQYLLAGVLLLLVAETVVANRQRGPHTHPGIGNPS